jgi:hypothetical protein
MTTIPAETIAAAIVKTPDPDETIRALVDFVAELEREHHDADPEIVIGDLAARAELDPRLSALVAVLETP